MSSDQTLRTTLHSAYTFIRSVEVNKAFSALTLDHLIQEQIDSYQASTTRPIVDAQGQNVGNRISKIDALTTLEKQVNDVVQAISNAGTDPAKLHDLGVEELDPG